MKTLYIDSYDTEVKPDISGTYEKIQIRKPIKPKLAKVKRVKQVGHRKWSTIFHVKDSLSNIVFSNEKEGVAIAYAKELAKKNIKEYYVTIAKALVNSDPLVASVSPSKSKVGRYKFLVMADQPQG